MEQLKNIKNLFLVSIVLWTVGSNAQKDLKYPKLPKSGLDIHDLIPDGWQVLSETIGDLNLDGYQDLAFAIQSPIKETIQYSDGIENDTIVTGPRILGVYFGKRNGKFKKALQSNTFILNRYTSTMDEPFTEIQILENGILQIDFQIWPCRDCSSWSTHEYRFRYQKKAFELVGYLESTSQRVSGEEVDYTIDFQKKTLKIITTTINDNDEREYEEELKNFELKQLQTLMSFVKPFEWEFLGLRI